MTDLGNDPGFRFLSGSYRPDELDDRLSGPAVTLGSVDVPLARRGLTGPATVLASVSVAELLATMSASYAAWPNPGIR